MTVGLAGPSERLLVRLVLRGLTPLIDLGRRQVANTAPTGASGLFLRERMELSNVLLLTKGGWGPLCGRFARRVGLKVKTAALFTMGPTTQRMRSNKTARMGDEGKAVWLRTADGFAV
jgi:hypothetical protein